jgi:hypothetical protein
MLAELAFAALLQTAPIPKNPRNIEFTCPDHDRDDQHELDIVRASDGETIQTIQLGDPPAGADGIVRATINVQPVAFGTYFGRVRVLAAGVRSENSPDSNQFQRTPGAPGPVIVK